MPDTVTCDDPHSLTDCGFSGTSNNTVVGIVLGCVFGVLLILLVIFCCRRERVLKNRTKEEEENLRRGSIARIKASIAAMRTSTALNEMSNVSKGVLKRQILEQLTIKTVKNVDAGSSSTDTGKKETFLQSLSKSNRAYSSFAAALSSSSGNNGPTEFVEAEDKTNDVEEGNTVAEDMKTKKEQEPAPVVDRRQSNAMARSLSIVLSKKDDTSKCYLCLLNYVKGDEVAFSKFNDKCNHQFHKDCIVEWLMKRTACPCCKEEYIESNKL
jgi:hypothetical protein